MITNVLIAKVMLVNLVVDFMMCLQIIVPTAALVWMEVNNMTLEEKIDRLECKLDCALELLKTIVVFSVDNTDDAKFLIEEIRNIKRM